MTGLRLKFGHFGFNMSMTVSHHQLQYAQTRHAQTRAATLFPRVIGHSRHRRGRRHQTWVVRSMSKHVNVKQVKNRNIDQNMTNKTWTAVHMQTWSMTIQHGQWQTCVQPTFFSARACIICSYWVNDKLRHHSVQRHLCNSTGATKSTARLSHNPAQYSSKVAKPFSS